MLKYFLSLTTTVAAICFSSSLVNAQATVACTAPSITTDTHGHVHCYTSDGFQQYKLYQISLCQEEPTLGNYEQVCQFLLDSTTGTSVELSAGSSASLLPDGAAISLSEGLYTHAAILIDEKIGLKGSYTFDKQLIGKSKIPGNQCWTTSGSWNEFYAQVPGYSSISEMPFECGSSPDPEYYFARYDAFSFSGFDVYAIPNRVSPTGTYGMYILDADKNLPNNGSGALSGDYMFGIQAFNEPISITPNTTSIEIGFRLTDMFNIITNFRDTRFNNTPADCGRNSNGDNACLVQVIPQGFEFTVTSR
jgi:hypothetical protein